MAQADAELLHPLKIDPETGEPGLQLVPPYAHIILTPQRRSDVPVFLKHLNDPRIYSYLGTALPYLEEHALKWIGRCNTTSEQVLVAAREGVKFLETCPVRAIRDISSSGIADARVIGDCGMDRYRFDSLAEGLRDDAPKLEKENAAKEVGDPTISWTIGDWIDPEYQGQGIMTAVVRAMIEQWAVPRMNARHIIAAIYLGNRASVRVFEKNGFESLPDVHDIVKIAESKGGGRTGLHVLEWRYKPEAERVQDVW
ncbi:acyl-CoA N-acyltransferase [Auricularia subglabra TFB-10046 SS5]|uniref:Acyl-CoA N-acyltransferase n=1 Tax=Auricularia subglabra (strain TFB-10046 / SS5) TaxID=717982 RepID=J0LHH7_AURST|nr:acyl-CoA N-acyltransferase [Auricularia subglabra TFB-10046 SS5]